MTKLLQEENKVFQAVRHQSRKLFRVLEVVLGVCGLALLGFYGAMHLDGFVHSRVAVEEFKTEISGSSSAASTRVAASNLPKIFQSTSVNFGLWSASRIAAFEKAWSIPFHPAIAVLKIPKLGMEVPVFSNLSQESLNRGVGWISGTAAPGEGGNVGIAGHRDGFFRKLKYISRGDHIILLTHHGTETFRVSKIEVVDPDSTSVLKSAKRSSLTLVTCYPFYYVGRAPQRFVVKSYLESKSQLPAVRPWETQTKGTWSKEETHQ